MAKITIDDQEFEIEEGKNLIDAIHEAGQQIPHYCYHPGLSIAGQCRMCLVELEGSPKLQIACNMKTKDGMKIKLKTDKVQSAVKWNLEFHLINHPIDCPICDQAGECGLQDYYMQYGKYESQMRENKVLKQKVVDLGDKVVLDKERCILCSRCVRFTDEVSQNGELAIFNRGDRSTIGTFNDTPLSGNYQLNTVDICPVGALTSKDFRFEQRVWFLDESQTVCGGCSKGCNVRVHHKGGRHIYRLLPRYHAEINGHWMCDIGRSTYKHSNYNERLTKARLGGVGMSMQEAIQNWGAELKALLATERTDEIGVWLTPHHTNEELHSIFENLEKKLGVTKFFSDDISKIVSNDHTTDGLLYRNDPYPNSAGFLKVTKGKNVKSLDQLLDQLRRNMISHLILFAGDGGHNQEMHEQIQSNLSLDQFVVLITPQYEVSNLFSQALSLPSLSHYEKNGHMTNHQGIEQKLSSPFRMFKETSSIEEILERLIQNQMEPEKKTGAAQ